MIQGIIDIIKIIILIARGEMPLKVFIAIGIAITIFFYIIKNEKRKKRDLTRRSVIAISSACSGIGKELALTFANLHHCNIVLLDTQTEGLSNVLSLVKEIKTLGGKGYFYECDFKDKNLIMLTLAKTIAKFGKIDIFIHTGGATFEKSFEDYCYEEMTMMNETHFLGPAFMIKELLTIMKKQPKGHIVHVPAVMGIFQSSDIFTSCAANGALNKLLQELQAGLRKSHPKMKITIARPYILSGEAIEEEDRQYKVWYYSKKVYNGIMYELDEINYR